jgi:type II secretory pathway pseudopilin PulG
VTQVDRRRGPGPERAAGDAGTTLLEVLMAIVLVSVAGLAVLTGLATSIRASDAHKKQVQVQLALVSAAERVKDPAVPRVPCATPTTPSYLAAARAADVPDGWDPATTIRITAVRYSNGTTFSATCNDTDALRHQLIAQLVTIEVESPDGRAKGSLVVAKGTQL